MKKVLSLVMAVVMLLSLVVGCGSKNADADVDTGAAEPVTIRYYDWDLVDASVIEKFMVENPDIIVEVYDVSANGDRTTQLDVLAMSGEIDVMPLADGDQFARFEQGMLANLDELIAEYGIDMDASFAQYAEWAKMDGSYYAVPYRCSKNALYYNKDIFDAAGVDYPENTWTQDDYLAAAADISAWGKDQGIYGTYSHTYGNEWAYLAAQVGEWYTEDGLCNIKDDVWVDALEMRTYMDNNGLQMPYSEIKASSTVINSSFLGGKEAMVMAGSWLVRDMKKTDKFPFDFDIGVASLPRFDDSVEGIRGNFSVSVLGIPETSKNKEAAFRFIMYLETQNAEAIAATGNVPCYVPAYNDELIATFADGSSLSAEDVMYFFDSEVVWTTNKILGGVGGTYMSIIKEEVEPYFFGEVELPGVLDNIESRVNELLAQG